MKKNTCYFPFHIHVGGWGKEVWQLLKQEIIIRKLSKKNLFQHGINV
jgi:hypothetical protein